MDWREAENRILKALDLRAEAERLGVRFTAEKPNAGGWLSCHAVGRDDATPSAAVNVSGSDKVRGRYKDLGGEEKSISWWEFDVLCGAHTEWKEARAAYAEQAGVEMSGQAAKPIDASCYWFTGSTASARAWCEQHKPGVSFGALIAHGAKQCLWPGKHSTPFLCIGLPGYREPDAEPTAWVLYRADGKTFPKIESAGAKIKERKIHNTAGSVDSWIVAGGIDALSAASVVWKVEGPSDAMALSTILPAGHIACTNTCGAAAAPNQLPLAWAAGKQVRVVGDADKAGTAGAERFAQAFANAGGEVRIVELPYPIEESHGKDLRDWLLEPHYFVDFQLLEDRQIFPSAESIAIQNDNDPNRLACLYVDAKCRHTDGNLTLRFWQESWWRWDGRRYFEIPLWSLRAELTQFVQVEFLRCNRRDIANTPTGKKPPCAYHTTTALIGNVLNAITGMVSIDSRTELFSWLDSDHGAGVYIPMSNGILDLQALIDETDNELLHHDPRWFGTCCLPYPFDVDANCVKWLDVVQFNLDGDNECIALVQEWFGYCLTRSTDAQKFLILQGDGNNGKTVIVAGLEGMLGADNVSHVPLEMFGQRFQLTPTLGKLVNIVGDVGELDRVAEGTLKSFTGGERMSFDRKNREPLEATPTARLVIAMNDPPRIRDRSDGPYRRMLLVPFERTIPDERRVYGMDKPTWWERSGELPGVFLWALAGLKRLLDNNGRFTIPEKIREAIEEYRKENNTARNFLMETCEYRNGAKTSKQHLFDIYRKWCENRGQYPLGADAFGKEIKRVFPKVTPKRSVKLLIPSENKRVNAYDGIHMKTELEKDQQEGVEHEESF